jgi:excisionase family DNA binding protein
MILTVKQAAEATGKSKPTILRAIQSHKISATRHEVTNAWMIDAAELHRIYPPASAQQVRIEPMMQGASDNDAVLLRRELALMTVERERERAQLQERIDDLTHRLDEEAAERRKLTAILTDQRERTIITPPPETPATAPAKRRWWQRGRRA